MRGLVWGHASAREEFGVSHSTAPSIPFRSVRRGSGGPGVGSCEEGKGFKPWIIIKDLRGAHVSDLLFQEDREARGQGGHRLVGKQVLGAFYGTLLVGFRPG